MAQGYFLTGKAASPATFDYFFRENPFGGGYVIFAGLEDLLSLLESLEFRPDDIDYLRSLKFHNDFLSYLQRFRFRGTIHSVSEGEPVFPLEPLVRVDGTLLETQLVETVLLNLLNFESLIATKASRIRLAAGDKRLVDFGLRRAQGLGGIHASKAAIIGGVDATSNVYSAFTYGLQTSGTLAHSWVQSFDDELSAFRTFAELFPDGCVLLVDTYNTLTSGIPNAIAVARELEKKGKRLLGIRLDSGDLAYLSKKARSMLDDAGLSGVKIVVSNQLDEYLIRSLLQQGAPVDTFGVGTRLVTAEGSPSLDGVYKMSMCDDKPRIKFSDNISKTTLPGSKKLVRYSMDGDEFRADGVLLDAERSVDEIHHPYLAGQSTRVSGLREEPLFEKRMEDGKRVSAERRAETSALYARDRLRHLSPEHRRFENPHTYKVGVSQKLLNLREDLSRHHGADGRSRRARSAG